MPKQSVEYFSELRCANGMMQYMGVLKQEGKAIVAARCEIGLNPVMKAVEIECNARVNIYIRSTGYLSTLGPNS